ncbi:MAG: hypothetical protein V1799_11795 [bacterium]
MFPFILYEERKSKRYSSEKTHQRLTVLHCGENSCAVSQSGIELGYLLVNNQLMLNDSDLDGAANYRSTSLAAIIHGEKSSLAQWIRGKRSFGSLLEKYGYSTVPSPAHPNPEGETYFSGGYNLEQHSAFSGKVITGIQVELPTGLREDDNKRKKFAQAFVDSILEYLKYLGLG